MANPNTPKHDPQEWRENFYGADYDWNTVRNYDEADTEEFIPISDPTETLQKFRDNATKDDYRWSL